MRSGRHCRTPRSNTEPSPLISVVSTPALTSLALDKVTGLRWRQATLVLTGGTWKVSQGDRDGGQMLAWFVTPVALATA